MCSCGFFFCCPEYCLSVRTSTSTTHLLIQCSSYLVFGLFSPAASGPSLLNVQVALNETQGSVFSNMKNQSNVRSANTKQEVEPLYSASPPLFDHVSLSECLYYSGVISVSYRAFYSQAMFARISATSSRSDAHLCTTTMSCQTAAVRVAKESGSPRLCAGMSSPKTVTSLPESGS